MSILLPLYVYPWPGVWDPLYWVAGNHTDLNFTVVLNPCSGPCLNSLPEQPYIDEMPKLKNFHNIRTLGYVATNYTNKPLDTVVAEIKRYADWAQIMNDPRVAVDGIFFDETPGLYDWKQHDYMAWAAKQVKDSNGLGQKLVVQNPGTLPDPTWNYLDTADITVIFEETFANFIDATRFSALKNFHNATSKPKSAFSIMLHSATNIPDELLDWTADQMKEMVDWGFASSVGTPGEYWHSFSSAFAKFIAYYARASRREEEEEIDK